MAKEILITQEGLEDLKNELEYLKVEKRTEIAEKIKIARSFGDLSENSEYDEAKNDQAKLEQRINEYKIVGTAEADPINGKISDESPIGKALIGHKEGETVVAETPDGELEFTIVKIVKKKPTAK